MDRARQPPPQLNAEETQQVLKRAAQLDKREETSAEPSLDLAEVERIGIEAGLSREAIQRAFVELRSGGLRARPAPGTIDRLLGPAAVSVERLLPDPPEVVRSQVEVALKAELLHPEERTGARTIWSSAPGLWAAIQRGLNWQGQKQWRRGTVISEVLPAPAGVEGKSVVRLEAIPGIRAGCLAGAIAPGLSILPVAIISTFAPGAPPEISLVFGAMSIGGTAIGLVISRLAYRKRLRALRQAIERVLDRLGGEHEQ